MASILWYLVDGVDAQGWQALSTSTQSAATTAAGWVVGTGTTNHSELFANTERAASTFTGTAVPDGTLDTTNKDAFRSPIALTGTFANANWTIQFAVRSPTQGGAHDGRVRFRLLKAGADGSGAVEITSGQQQASQVTDVSNSADFNSTLTFNPGAFTLDGEFLFIQVAWERIGAGGMASTNIRFRTGSASTPTGTVVTTADFTPSPFESGRRNQPATIARVFPAAVITYLGLNLLGTTLAPITPVYTSDQTTLLISAKSQQPDQPQNLLGTTLASAEAQPFTPLDWNNPVIVVPRLQQFEQQNLLGSTLVVEQQTPFSQQVWQNPFVLSVPQQFEPQNLLGGALTSQAPFVPPLWEFPRNAAGALAQTEVQNVLSTLLAEEEEAEETVYTNEQTTLLIGRRDTPRWVPGNLLGTTLTPVAQDPFKPGEWTNPLRRVPQLPASITAGSVLQQLVPYRFVDLGDMFALPQGRPFLGIRLETQSFPLLVNGNPVPFQQLDWPVVQPLSRQQPSVNQNTLVSTEETTAPFAQTTWPNPKHISLQQPTIDQNIFIRSVGEAPFFQTDWTNPLRPTPVASSFEQNFVVKTIVAEAAPFTQQVWVNPSRAVSTLLTEHNSAPKGEDVEAVEEPFRQNEWPNPRGKRQFFAESRGGDVSFQLVPYRPIDLGDMFAVPQRRIFVVRKVDERSFAIVAAGNPVPTHQTEWPVQRVIPRLQHNIEQNTIVREVVETAPFSQNYWPNPGTLVRVSGVDSQNFALIHDTAQPFNQTAWPNPPGDVLATLAGGTPNFALTVVGNPVPFNQLAWAVPTRASELQPQTIINNTVLTVVELPFATREWQIFKAIQRSQESLDGSFPLLVQASTPFQPIQWTNPVRSATRPQQFNPPNLRTTTLPSSIYVLVCETGHYLITGYDILLLASGEAIWHPTHPTEPTHPILRAIHRRY